jgi:hypothetical protein
MSWFRLLGLYSVGMGLLAILWSRRISERVLDRLPIDLFRRRLDLVNRVLIVVGGLALMYAGIRYLKLN